MCTSKDYINPLEVQHLEYSLGLVLESAHVTQQYCMVACFHICLVAPCPLCNSYSRPNLQLGGHAGTGQQTANRAGAQAQDLGNRAGQQAQRAGDQAGQTARNAQAQAGQTARNAQQQAGQAAQGIQQQAYQALDAAQPYIDQAKQVASEYGAVAADKARELGSIAQAQGGDTLRLATQSLISPCWCQQFLLVQACACMQGQQKDGMTCNMLQGFAL